MEITVSEDGENGATPIWDLIKCDKSISINDIWDPRIIEPGWST